MLACSHYRNVSKQTTRLTHERQSSQRVKRKYQPIGYLADPRQQPPFSCLQLGDEGTTSEEAKMNQTITNIEKKVIPWLTHNQNRKESRGLRRKEHDQQTKTKETQKKLTYYDSKEEGSKSSKTKGLTKQSSNGSSIMAKTRNKACFHRKSLRSLSHSKTSSHLRRSDRLGSRGRSKAKAKEGRTKSRTRRFRHKETSLDSDYEEGSEDTYEDLKLTQQKRYAKDRTEIHGIKRRLNKGLQAFMDIFKSESSHIKGVPPVLRISAFIYGYRHSELAKKLNDKIPKTMDKMFERVRAFIKGEVAARSTKIARAMEVHGCGNVKVINTVGLGGNLQRSYEIEEPRAMEEITFLAIPQNSLTYALIILE
nr:reverse transcriptase domain-containing protein [Tanacetum cinerariifolium]